MITRLAICSWGLSKYCASAVQGIAQCDNALELIEVFGPSGALLYSCRHSRQPIDFHIKPSVREPLSRYTQRDSHGRGISYVCADRGRVWTSARGPTTSCERGCVTSSTPTTSPAGRRP